MGESGTFSFFGRVHPERAAAAIGEVSLQHRSQFINFEIDIFTHGSQLLVQVHPESEVEDLDTLQNLVQSSVSSITDPFAFIYGKHVSVEITGAITPSGSKRVFGIEHGYIAEKTTQNGEADEWYGKILDVYSTDAAPYLQRAFRDYRLALEHAEDTGFYCFRSIESLRQFYKESDDTESWERLRSDIEVSRETIEQGIQIYAKDRRHGDVYSLSGEERKEILETTWTILSSFIDRLSEQAEDGSNEPE
ncbi:hypothetical protein [Halorubrum lipolyticum]|uniref:hypothetical protein n=1 Tax=Halorubrum lipolyticum TaxID=368624 RepID=UPI0011C9754C|nr:hypothetical protein [Halorubrum lipolyticum]